MVKYEILADTNDILIGNYIRINRFYFILTMNERLFTYGLLNQIRSKIFKFIEVD